MLQRSIMLQKQQLQTVEDSKKPAEIIPSTTKSQSKPQRRRRSTSKESNDNKQTADKAKSRSRSRQIVFPMGLKELAKEPRKGGTAFSSMQGRPMSSTMLARFSLVQGSRDLLKGKSNTDLISATRALPTTLVTSAPTQ
ncbi:hypothetical protein FGO68_gene2211 [Halteria grandinella]|uniref:Uncharacterized protein n=1 Tax=Halteria grandinella TaxID=5974 RepID=A0A8J8T2X8_HALGN|nr:hypothetical protein FGO68_gene2211 [Halteria grandinella]